jgi:HD superfamily phosphodiesterase
MISSRRPTIDRDQELVGQVEAWVRHRLEKNGSVAHGWPHTHRVRCNVLPLARAEGVDPVLAEVAALLHDVGRTQPGPESEHGARSATMAEPLLADLPLSAEERRAVLHAVRWHNSARRDTPLLLVLRDADMLDGLGAIGLMRAFMSQAHLLPYDPDAPFDQERAQRPPLYVSDQIWLQYKFYDWLNTATARQMAEARFAFMAAFVTQMHQELSDQQT